MQGNIKTESPKLFNSQQILNVQPECKYIGVRLHSKLFLVATLNMWVKELSKQCGMVAKLRHFVPRKQWIDYFSTIINSIIQYVALVYCCCKSARTTGTVKIALLKNHCTKRKSSIFSKREWFIFNKLTSIEIDPAYMKPATKIEFSAIKSNHIYVIMSCITYGGINGKDPTGFIEPKFQLDSHPSFVRSMF